MSDNIDQIRKFGLLPFGGGGIFVSVPLAAKMTSPEVWEKCMEIPDNQGDQIVSECLNMHTRVRPTFDQGLNQMDFRGDDNVAAGYFESGRQMLTVHHWRSWYNVDMPTVGLVGKACGNEGLLMRWVFDNNFVLSNGYSIVEYPNGADKINFEHVEMTMEAGSIPKYIHKIGPLREKLPDEDKKTFKMLDAEIVEGWGVRQTYIEKAPREKIKDEKEGEGKKEEKVIIHGDDRVVELVWLF
ncbi:hypothetical protein B0J14DRAFT_530060 [Halenospora varia]|nr:hypothetical protein B0J14DRAFT_530060 [Halenospora varia]